MYSGIDWKKFQEHGHTKKQTNRVVYRVAAQLKNKPINKVLPDKFYCYLSYDFTMQMFNLTVSKKTLIGENFTDILLRKLFQTVQFYFKLLLM